MAQGAGSARARLYEAFSEVFLPPSDEQAAALADGRLVHRLDELMAAAGFARGFLPADASLRHSDPKRVREAYWDAFENPKGARVHLVESVYRPWTQSADCGLAFARDRGWLGGDSAAHLEAVYGETGLEPPPEFAHAPDHLALELELMALLAEQGSREQQDRFLAQHLSWMPDLVARAQSEGIDSLYLQLLRMANAVVARDMAASATEPAPQ